MAKNTVGRLAAMICVGLLIGGTALAEDTPEVAAAKNEKAVAEARRDAAKAEAERLKTEAEIARLRADPSGGPKAEAEARKAVADAEKAEADARAAATAAEVAETKAQFGSVTGTTLGTTTAEKDAGGIEASILAAQAVDKTAAVIAQKMPTLPAGRRYIIFTGATRPNFADLRWFEMQEIVVTDSFARAAFQFEQLDNFDAVSAEVGGPRVESVAGAVTSVGAVLDIASKLGSYFQADYKVTPVTVAGVTDDLLAVSVAGRLTNAWYPGRWMPLGSDKPITDVLIRLAKLRDEGAERLTAASAKQKLTNEKIAKEQDPKKKEALQKYADQLGRVISSYTAANKAFDDLLAALATAEAGVPRAAKVAEQATILKGMADGDMALILNITTSGGTGYTKKSLWTFLGGMPYFVSGGAVVTYIVFDKDGTVRASGQAPVHSGFVRVTKVPK